MIATHQPVILNKYLWTLQEKKNQIIWVQIQNDYKQQTKI